jgi:hypothetical protein
MNRREQLFLLWAASATILAIGLALTTIIFAMPRITSRVTLGRADSFCPPNSINVVDLPLEFADPLAISRTSPRVWVVRDGVGKFTAFFARSTFHGYPVNWVPEHDRFEDPSLGSTWNREGQYLFGPDPRDLDRFPVTIESGQVFIELRLIKGMPHE